MSGRRWTNGLRLVDDTAVRPVARGSVSADVRAEWLTEELTRQMYFLDEARAELFAALALRDYDGQVAAVERLGAVAKRMRERSDRSARPVL